MLQTAQAEPAAAEGDGEDFGDWADTDAADAATVGGVPQALAPYLRAWTQLLKARHHVGFESVRRGSYMAGRAAWRQPAASCWLTFGTRTNSRLESGVVQPA